MMYGKEHFSRIAVGSTVKSLRLNSFETYELFIPPLPEQRAIAETLSCLDDKIELNNRMNKKLEEIAQAIFKSWFIEFDPFQDGEFIESELGKIPRGWRMGDFTEEISILGGGTPKTTQNEYWGGDIPFFTPKDVANSSYVIGTEKYMSQLGLNNCNSKLYPINTVFITVRGTVGKISLAGCDMAMNQSCYALLSKKELGQLFIHQLSMQAVESLSRKANGAVFEALVTRDFSTEFVVYPPQKIADEFENLVKPMYETILKNTFENKKLATIRDALLPKLMSGEIRVV